MGRYCGGYIAFESGNISWAELVTHRCCGCKEFWSCKYICDRWGNWATIHCWVTHCSLEWASVQKLCHNEPCCSSSQLLPAPCELWSWPVVYEISTESRLAFGWGLARLVQNRHRHSVTIAKTAKQTRNSARYGSPARSGSSIKYN